MAVTREQVVQWAKQAWDDTGEGWTNGRWFDERAPSFEAFATLARADLEAELESLRNALASIVLSHGDSTSAVPEKYWDCVKIARKALAATA